MNLKFLIAMNVPKDILEIDIYVTTNNIEEFDNSLYSHFCMNIDNSTRYLSSNFKSQNAQQI